MNFLSTLREHPASMTGMSILVLALGFRKPLESSMALHMLLQIPAILLAGYLIASQLPCKLARRLAIYDEYGITGLLAFMLGTAYWMIPRALEYPLTSVLAEAAKVISLLAIGGLFRGSLSRANNILRVFFIGNLSSMMAIVGMLYQDAPQRLCNQYLYDDQVVTGTALVVIAAAIPILWVTSYFIFPAPAAPAEHR